MADLNWELADPIVENVQFSRDAGGFWNVQVSLRESTPKSLGGKVVRAKLKVDGKEAAQSLWPVAGSRSEEGISRTTMTFQTGSALYPHKAKFEVELTER